MTRETKIGIALMVLLVGVFGAMVYKKWNGRQPTAVAKAAVADADAADVATAEPSAAERGPTPAVNDDPFAPTPAAMGPTPAPIDPTPVAMEPTPAADNPFADDTASVPVAQKAAADPFGAAGFEPDAAVADVPVADVPDADAAMRPTAAIPPAQSEPGDSAESLFPGDTLATTEQPTPADADAAASTADAAMAAADVVPAVSDDPFAEPMPAQSMTEAAATPTVPPATDDPFSDAPPATTAATESPAEEMTEPSSSAETVQSAPATIAVDTVTATGEPAATTASTEDPFADAEPAVEPAAEPVAMTPVAEPVAGETEPGTAAAPLSPADDPFSEPQAPVAATPATKEMPGRFPEGEAAPVAVSDAAAMQESAFEEPAASEPMPATRSGQVDHYVVAENDSYWTISKRVYGTPIFFHALARYNAARVPNPERLKPGMTILTPPPQELSARFPKLVSQGETTQATSQEPGFLIDDQGRPSYRVGKDDTLTEIAQLHLGRASRWVQIYEMNREIVQDPKTLKPGAVLRLPADASRVRLVPEG